MTRREWLTKNPPPRAAKSIQALLDGLNVENAKRAEMADLRQRWVTHRDYWNARLSFPGEAAQAQQQVRDANAQITEADKSLVATGDVPTRIQQLQEELKRAARCPVHRTDLYRNLNRPEDMFTCENGPHQLFWTRVNGSPGLIALETLALPGLDYAMTDGVAITRAQWLDSHRPQSPICPLHADEVAIEVEGNRKDVFRCKQNGQQYLWSPTAVTGVGILVSWQATKPLPSLEDPV